MKEAWLFALYIFGVVVFVVLVLFLGSWTTWVKALNEANCNQRAEELQVVDGDYRLLSDRCFLTLSDGRVIDANQLRPVEGVER